MALAFPGLVVDGRESVCLPSPESGDDVGDPFESHVFEQLCGQTCPAAASSIQNELDVFGEFRLEVWRVG